MHLQLALSQTQLLKPPVFDPLPHLVGPSMSRHQSTKLLNTHNLKAVLDSTLSPTP